MKKLLIMTAISLFFAACPETVPVPETEGTKESAENERFLIADVAVTPISGTNETEFTWKAEIQTSVNAELTVSLDGVSEIGKKTLSGIDEPHSISGTIETPLSLGSHSVIFTLTADGRPSLSRTAYFEVRSAGTGISMPSADFSVVWTEGADGIVKANDTFTVDMASVTSDTENVFGLTSAEWKLEKQSGSEYVSVNWTDVFTEEAPILTDATLQNPIELTVKSGVVPGVFRMTLTIVNGGSDEATNKAEKSVDFTVDAKYFGETIYLGNLTLTRSPGHFYTFDNSAEFTPENGVVEGGVVTFADLSADGFIELSAPEGWCAVVIRARFDSGTGTPNLYFGSSETDYYTYFRNDGVSVYDSSWTTLKESGMAWSGGMEEGVFCEFLVFKDGSSILMRMGEESRILKDENFSALPASSIRFGFEVEGGTAAVSVDEIGFYTLASSDQTSEAPQNVEIEGTAYGLVKAFNFNDSDGFSTSGTVTVSGGKASVPNSGTTFTFEDVEAFDYVEVRLKYDGHPNLFFDGITAQHFTFFRPQPVDTGYNVWTAPADWNGVPPTTTYWNYERTKNAYGVYGFAFTDSTVRYLFDRFWAADNGTANAPSSTLSPVLMIQKEKVEGGVTVDIDYVAFYKK